MKIEPFPSRIVLELTPLCNLACPMCPRHYVADTDGYMSGVLFRTLIDEVRAENDQAVVLPFWRGESCLHPEFEALLGYALDKGMRIHLSTNGHFMEPAFREVFYRCEFVTFSLHDRRGYQNAMELTANKPAWSRTTLQVSFVDSEKTTAKFLHECTTNPELMGLDSVRLYVEHSVNGEFGRSTGTTDGQRSFCPKLTDTFVVAADGRYSRCNHIWTSEAAPNLADSTIREIWSGTRMSQIRSRYPDEQCTPCDQWSGHTQGEAWRRTQDGRVTHLSHGSAP